MKTYSCEQMRTIEENANSQGTSFIQMMENAGKACFDEIYSLAKEAHFSSVAVLCGSGKNGGDGFVIARYLNNSGFSVSVILTCGQPKAEEAAETFSRMNNDAIGVFDYSSLPDECEKIIRNSEVIVDCIFGIGFKGALRGGCLDAVVSANGTNALRISVDIPSGLEGDSNTVNGEFFKADYTLAVTCRKPVHALRPTAECCGEIRVVDIGFSKDCYDSVDCAFNSADDAFVKASLPVRRSDSNKGTYGKLLSICGSMRMQGAAVLCAEAAVKSGVGLITCAFPQKAYSAIASKLTEPLMLPLADDELGFLTRDAVSEITEKVSQASAVVIGCGLGVTDGTRKIFEEVVKNSKSPILIDADGLNILSENIDILKTAKAPVVLTPHPGEMSRLLSKSIDDIQQNRVSACKELSVRTGAVVLLKGCNTVICKGEVVYINPTGNQGMAKGGSGDVLSGVIGSFLAQGMDAFESAVCGAYIHGLSGDTVAKEYSLTGATPTMMIDALPKLFSNLENKAD